MGTPKARDRAAAQAAGTAGKRGAALLAAPGEAQPFAPVPFVWSDQYDLKIQSAGVVAGADTSQVVHGSLEERQFLKLYGRAGRLTGALAFNEPRRLIGYRRQLRKEISWEDALAAAQA